GLGVGDDIFDGREPGQERRTGREGRSIVAGPAGYQYTASPTDPIADLAADLEQLEVARTAAARAAAVRAGEDARARLTKKSAAASTMPAHFEDEAAELAFLRKAVED